jgi:hypothetical protein
MSMVKARFYRGPWDGKVKHVQDNQYTILINSVNGSNLFKDYNSPVVTAPITVQTHIYRRTQHTHPDGSVFFEWDKPRGTKTGLKRRPKKKAQPTMTILPDGTLSVGPVKLTASQLASRP